MKRDDVPIADLKDLWDPEQLPPLCVGAEVLRVAMDWDQNLRFEPAVELLKLLTAGVPRDVNTVIDLADDLDPEMAELPLETFDL